MSNVHEDHRDELLSQRYYFHEHWGELGGKPKAPKSEVDEFDEKGPAKYALWRLLAGPPVAS
jgi:hypothetical protein